MMTRLVGLIGGMSWRTTALYYQEINLHVAARLGGLHSANLLVRSLDYAQVAQLVTKEDFGGMSKLLCQAGQELKAAGAQAVALCANVAHKAADAIGEDSGLPVLHVVDFVGDKVAQHGFRRVGLLATRAVMEEKSFYRSRLKERYGLEVFAPRDETFLTAADHHIFQEMSKPVIPEQVKAAWQTAYSDLVRHDHVDCVVLACTELRLIFGDNPEETPTTTAAAPTFETTTLHARGIADWILGPGPGPRAIGTSAVPA